MNTLTVLKMEVVTQVMTFFLAGTLPLAHALTVPFFSGHWRPCPLSSWPMAGNFDLLASAFNTYRIFRFALDSSVSN